jgi:hypothetical protein
MQFLKKMVRAFSASHAFPFSRICVLVGRLSALNLVRRQFHYRVICWKELSVGRRCCGKVSSKPYTTPPWSQRFSVGRRHPFADTNLAKSRSNRGSLHDKPFCNFRYSKWLLRVQG